MKRLLACVVLATLAAGAGAEQAAPGGAVPLDGWTRDASAAGEAPTAPPAVTGSAQDVALGLHAVPDRPIVGNPWTLLAVAALALGYVLAKRPR